MTACYVVMSVQRGRREVVASPRTYLEVWKLLRLRVGDGTGDLAGSDALVYLSLQCLVGVWCGQEIEHDAPDDCRRVIRAASDLDHGFNLTLVLVQAVTDKRALRATMLVAFPTMLGDTCTYQHVFAIFLLCFLCEPLPDSLVCPSTLC